MKKGKQLTYFQFKYWLSSCQFFLSTLYKKDRNKTKQKLNMQLRADRRKTCLKLMLSGSVKIDLTHWIIFLICSSFGFTDK